MKRFPLRQDEWMMLYLGTCNDTGHLTLEYFLIFFWELARLYSPYCCMTPALIMYPQPLNKLSQTSYKSSGASNGIKLDNSWLNNELTASFKYLLFFHDQE